MARNIKSTKVLDTQLWTIFRLAIFLFYFTPFSLLGQSCSIEQSNVTFDFNECSSFVIAGTNTDYSEFTANPDFTTDCPTISIVGDNLYRDSPSSYSHSCTPGFEGSKAMCVSSAESCDYNADSPHNVIIDLVVTPGTDGISRFSGMSFLEQAPESFNWIDGESGVNNYPELYGLSIYNGEDLIFTESDISTNLTWSLQEFDFSSIPGFETDSITQYKVKLVSYCPVGSASPIRAWDIENLEIWANCPEPVDAGEIIFENDQTEITICNQDGIDDTTTVLNTNPEGANLELVFTQDNPPIILGTQTNLNEINLESAPNGVCNVYLIAYENITGLETGSLITDLAGCFDLSNALTINREGTTGGSLSGGPFEFCVDGSPDFVSGVSIMGNEGTSFQWVVTDEVGDTILGLPANIEDVDFDEAGVGTCLIWGLSYSSIENLDTNNAIADLTGCFSFSDSITVVRTQTEAGEITGGPFDFCIGDGISDFVEGITLTGNTGTNSQWLVTDETASVILGLPANPEDVDFETAGGGVCLIWHLAYEGNIVGLEVDSLISNIEGCYDLSNAITVTRNEVIGGMLTGGPFAFCVDGVPDFISNVDLTGNSGMNTSWVITNGDTTEILGLPMDPTMVDFDEAGTGVCLLWSLTYDDGLTGLEMGADPGNLSGCYSFSNPITVSREGPAGGVLSGGPFEFCVGDGIPDNVSGIVLTDNVGPNSQWVITDETGTMIVGLPNDINEVNFDEAGLGVCLIWNLSYEDGITGLMEGGSIADLDGCFGLSNSISVTRTEANGGTITGGPFEFCVGDGIPDNVSGIELTGNSGANSQWIITSGTGEIVGLPPNPEEVDFDGAGAGTCLIWHVSYADGLMGLEIGGNIETLVGCSSISNAIQVVRNQPAAGTLEGGPFSFCVGDGIADFVSGITQDGNTGPNQQWIITSAIGDTILGLPTDIEMVDFDIAGNGTCLIWNISADDNVTGIEMGNTIADIVGCFNLSNSITVERGTATGGTISGGPFNFCVGDGIEDNPTGVVLSGDSGANSQWVITDEMSEVILGLPSSPGAADFDGAGPGTCLLWHLSYADGLTGLVMNDSIANLNGCFSFSNSITVVRTMPEGGNIFGGPFEFCVGDGMPDNVTGVSVTNNSGQNSQWVITDELGEVIIGLPTNPESVDFDGAGVGICRIWHMSYTDGLTGLEVNGQVADIVGCYDLSNAIVVNRIDCGGGSGETIVINEIAETNQVEIKNVSNNTIDISQYYLCNFPQYEQLSDDMTMACGNDLILDPGEITVITTSFVTIDAADGELGLYTSNSFNDPDLIIDYLEWGSTGHQRSVTATMAGIWTSGDFVPAWNPTNALKYDGTGDASTDWSEDVSSFCSENTIASTGDAVAFKLYPNPSNEHLMVNMLSTQKEDCTVRIYDAIGNLIKSMKKVNLTENMLVDITELRDGKYVIQISNAAGVKSKIFTKVKI